MPKSERYYLSVHKQQSQRKGASLSFSASFFDGSNLEKSIDDGQASDLKSMPRVLRSADGLMSPKPPLTLSSSSPNKADFLSASEIGRSNQFRGDNVTPTIPSSSYAQSMVFRGSETESGADISRGGVGMESIGRPTIGLDYLISQTARSRRSSSAIFFPSLESWDGKKATSSKLESELDKLKVDLERVKTSSGGSFR